MEIETKYTSKDPNDVSPEEGLTTNEPTNGSVDIDVILKDLAAGSMAGVANVLSGHPFE